MRASITVITLLLSTLCLFGCDEDLDPFEDVCKDVECGPNGQCQPRNGAAACVCNPCYRAEGLTCVLDRDPCQGVTCSGHGTCVWAAGCTARCNCESGYQAHMDTYCAPEQTGDGSFCFEDGWCVLNPQTTPAMLDGVWGTASDDVYMVGTQGTIAHWDGQQWSRVKSGVREYLLEIFGFSADDIWAVGARGTIVHLDGETVLDMSIEHDGYFSNVWGFGPDDVWAVGGTQYDSAGFNGVGVVVHWDGRSWTVVDVPEATQALWSVWGFGTDDVWATGNGGLILHYDGTEWSEVSSGTTQTIFEVWGLAPDDVWAVGRNSTVLHWDGATWSPETVPGLGLYTHVFDVWGLAADDVWLATDQRSGFGKLYNWNGSSWTEVLMPSENDGWEQAIKVWAANPNDLWVVGTLIFHWDGQSWTSFRGKPDGCDGWLYGIWGTAADDFWVGGNFSLHHYDGTGYTEIEPLEGWSYYQITDIWGTSSDDVWVTGYSSPSLFHWNGTELAMQTYGDAGAQSLSAVWGIDENNVWFGSIDGSVYYFDGTDITQTYSGPTDAIRGLWGTATSDVWAVGLNGVVLRWDGGAWSSMDTGYNDSHEDVWGTGLDDVWVVGERINPISGNPVAGVILHWDGSDWSRQEYAEYKSLRAVMGTGPDDVWIAGVVDPGPDGDDMVFPDDNAVLLHFDGVSWTPSPVTDSMVALFDLFIMGEHLFATGPFGTILHKGPALP